MSWKNTERIIQYWDEETPEEDKRRFEKDMETDEDLREEFHLFKTMKAEVPGLADIHEVINDPQLGDALALADETLTEYFEEKDKIENSKLKIIDNSKKQKFSEYGIKKLHRAILPLAAILTIGLIVKIAFIKPSVDALYSKYYSQTILSYSNLRGESTSLNSAYILANTYYINQDFQKADSVLSRSGQDLLTSPDYFFFRGLIKMGMEDFETAGLSFEKYLDSYEKMQIEAEWYLSLCYLKLELFESAGEILESLGSYQNIYQVPSENLLRKIRRLKK